MLDNNLTLTVKKVNGISVSQDISCLFPEFYLKFRNYLLSWAYRDGRNFFCRRFAMPC